MDVATLSLISFSNANLSSGLLIKIGKSSQRGQESKISYAQRSKREEIIFKKHCRLDYRRGSFKPQGGLHSRYICNIYQLFGYRRLSHRHSKLVSSLASSSSSNDSDNIIR